MNIHSTPQVGPGWRNIAGVNSSATVAMAERPLMFAYWGRSGAIPKLTLDLANVAKAQSAIRCTFSHSTFNELSGDYGVLGPDGFPVPTFKIGSAALWGLGSVFGMRRRLGERLRHDGTRAFVSLMPHIWSPLVAPVIRRAGVRHVVVVHDADPHPGDRNGIANRWLLREAEMADHVVTLSRFVAGRLIADRGFSQDKISTLFHPDLRYRVVRQQAVNREGPPRVAFVGRVLPYKGLETLVSAAELLRNDGVAIEVGIYGRGRITASVHRRLSALGATVVNRWLSHDELADAFSRIDVVVAAHSEASQSGVVAAAYGAGVPVIVSPVGGLAEQVVVGVTGIVADAATPRAIAEAIGAVAADRALLETLQRGVAATREERSPERFFHELCRIALA